MGKNQAEKNTIKQNLNIVKAYREEGKNKEKWRTYMKQKYRML